jgi:hypothetical protein
VGHLHGGTASGVRSQNREIKYKNPLSSLRRKAPWPRSRTVRRLAMRHRAGLKRLASCSRSHSSSGRHSKREGGPLILGGFGPRYRMGSHAEIFFRGGGDLIIFLEIKAFKRPCVCGRKTSGVTASTWTGPCARSGSAEAALRGFIFRACLRAPGGGQNSGIRRRGPWGRRARIFREIARCFFYCPEQVGVATAFAESAEKLPRNSGGGGSSATNGNMK